LPSYTVIENLLEQVQTPQDGTLSRTIHHDDGIKLVLLAFAGGQQLPQHTTAVPVILEILQGDARVTLDGQEKELATGSWVFMEANLPHAIYARTDMVMLLTMLTGAQPR
jgi:quercetin dioxygenase-like cupin family protein